jgi:hypothetical protein
MHCVPILNSMVLIKPMSTSLRAARSKKTDWTRRDNPSRESTIKWKYSIELLDKLNWRWRLLLVIRLRSARIPAGTENILTNFWNNDLQSDENKPTFQNISPPSPVYLLHVSSMLNLFYDHYNGREMLLWNNGWLSTEYKALHTWRQLRLYGSAVVCPMSFQAISGNNWKCRGGGGGTR